MDGEAFGSRAADTLAQQQGFATFWKNAKRKFESILNSISNTMPVHDLDAYERQRIETLVDALERAAQIRRKSQDLEYRRTRSSKIWNERKFGYSKMKAHKIVCTKTTR